MRPQKVEDKQLINSLMKVLRTKGYDGASLNELAAASGLQKASLYHRFPGGKKDIVIAVLKHITEWSKLNIVEVINNIHQAPEEKLSLLLKNIDAFYNGGLNSCVMKTLSMDNAYILFEEHLKNGISSWLVSFKQLALLFNHDDQKASEIAYEVIIQIQGSLVLSKVLGDTFSFKKALISIQNLYKPL